jgi:RHS repeat-associated protein
MKDLTPFFPYSTSTTGAVNAATTFDAFGNSVTQGTTQNKFGYTGHETDRNTGLIYFKARHYDPELGRFISADAFEGEAIFPVTWNGYLYANGNPFFYIDRNGYYSWSEFGDDIAYGTGAAVGGVVGGVVGAAELVVETAKFVGDAGLAVGGNKGGIERMNERGKDVATLLLQPQIIKQKIDNHIEATTAESASRRAEGNQVYAGFGLGFEGGETAGALLLPTLRFSKVPGAKSVPVATEARVTKEIATDIRMGSEPAAVQQSVPANMSKVEEAAARRQQVIENNISADDASFGLVRDAKVLAADRKALAESFYKEQGFSEKRTADHLRGTDFNDPVAITDIHKGTELVQYQIPGAPLGNYFAPPGTPGNQLGFYTSGRQATPYITTETMRALQSTAASTIDDWSMKAHGWSIETPGGGTQFFTTSKAVRPK